MTAISAQIDQAQHQAETQPAGFWQATRLVAKREFIERGRDRSFFGSTAITLVILLGVIVLPPLFGAGDPTSYKVAFTGPDAAAVESVVRAQAEQLDFELEPGPATDPANTDSAALEAAVRDGDLDAVVGADAVVVDDELEPVLGAALQQAYAQVRRTAALQASGFDPDAVAAASTIPPLPVNVLNPRDAGSETREQVSFLGTIVLYGQLAGYGFWVALGVVEEKSSRVVEVLLAAVPARALLAGKVLGIGLLGFAQLLLIAAVGITAAVGVGVIEASTELVTPVALVLGWFVLGYAFYAGMFAAGAARVSRQEELQSVTGPATLIILVSLFAAFYAGNNPDTPLAQVLSIVPPFSALVNPARTSAGDASIWALVLAVVLMLLAIAGLIAVAARLYEGAVLRMGGKVSLRTAWSRGR